MTFNEYTRIEENCENIQDLFYTWEDVRNILKKFRGNSKFREIYNFVENHSDFLYRAMKEAKQALLTDEAADFRKNNEGEVLCWKLDRKEPLSIPINFDFDPCYEISYSPMDEFEENVRFGMGI